MESEARAVGLQASGEPVLLSSLDGGLDEASSEQASSPSCSLYGFP